MRDDRMEALNKYLEKQRIRDEKRSQGIEPDSESDDDNPFAMYKPEAKHKKYKTPADDANTPSENCPALETCSLRIIDPGPSTSKDSQPWSSPSTNPFEKHESQSDSDDDALYINVPNALGKHRATVKVMTKGKLRKFSRATKKKSIKKEKQAGKSNESVGNADDQLRENDNEPVDNAPTDDTAETLQNANDEISENTETAKKQEVEISNTAEDVSASPNDKRKVEKQQKRDEKMRFMSERLKKAAEELRLRTSRSDEVFGTKLPHSADEMSENAEPLKRMEIDVSNPEVELESTIDKRKVEKQRVDEKTPLVSEKSETEQKRLD